MPSDLNALLDQLAMASRTPGAGASPPEDVNAVLERLSGAGGPVFPGSPSAHDASPIGGPGRPGDMASRMGPLLALAAVAFSRGGRPAVQGVLQGMADQRAKAEEQRQTVAPRQQVDPVRAAQEARLQQTADEAREDRQHEAVLKAEERRRAFIERMQTSLQEAVTPDELDERRGYWQAAAQEIGIDPGFVSLAVRAITPSRLQQRQAERVWQQLTKTYPAADLEAFEVAGQTFPVGHESLTIPVLRARATSTPVIMAAKQRTDAKAAADQAAAIERRDAVKRLEEALVAGGMPRAKAIVEAERQIARARHIESGGAGGAGGSGGIRPPAAADTRRERQEDYTAERGRRAIASIDRLLPKISRWTTGFGSLFAGWPESEAGKFQAEVSSLKSAIASNELAQMRAASATGGALGNVSDRDLALLESALGPVDPRTGPEAVRAQLLVIRGVLEKWGQRPAGEVVDLGGGITMREVVP